MAPITRRRQAEMEANSSAADEPSPVPKATTAKKRGQKLALRGKDDDDKSPPKAAAKSNITVFDDEEMSKPVVIEDAVSKPAPVEEEEDEDESDDEAPEAVSTSKVADEIKSAAKATQKAAQEQATAQKRKRQERDALLKKQAEERKKQEEEAAKADESKSLTTARSSAAARKRGGQVEVPDLLPAEFLTDSDGESGDEEGDADAAGARGKPKRRKVATVERSLTRLDKGPRDATIGSTVYQVAKKTDGRLAPKVKQHSKSTKDLLLKRNRAPAKSARGGFLAKK